MAGTVDQLIKLSGDAEIKAKLAAVGKEGERAFSGIEKSANSASGAVSKVGDAAGKASGGVSSVGKAAAEAADAFLMSGRFATIASGGILGLGAALVGLAKSYLDTAAAAQKMVLEQARAAQRVGQTSKNFAQVGDTLKLAGVDAATTGELFKVFGANATETLKKFRELQAKKGVFFAPGPGGDAAALKQLGKEGGNAGQEFSRLAEQVKQSGASFDPATGAMELTTEVLARLFDNLQKMKSPLERIQSLMKMGVSLEGARDLEPIAALGGDPIRKRAEAARRLQNADEQRIKEQEAVFKRRKEAEDKLAIAADATTKATGTRVAKVTTPVVEQTASALTDFNKGVEKIAGADVADIGKVIDFAAGVARQKWEEFKASLNLGGLFVPVQTEAQNLQFEFNPEAFSSLVSAAQAAFDAIIAGAQRTAEQLKKILPGGGSPALVVPSGPGEMASGGSVRGPGSGTSDSILARLSNGEYVVKAAAVRHYGSGMLAAINAMRFAKGGPVPGFAAGGQAGGQQQLLERAVSAGLAAAQATNKEMQQHHKNISDILNNLLQAFTGGIGGLQIGFGRAGGGLVRGFNMGGMVNALAPMLPGLAGGGLAPAPSQSRSLHPVTINMPGGGSHGGWLAPPSVVDRLESEVLRKSPAGRAPSWRGR